MKLKFSPSVAQIQKVSYAKEEEENFLLDCGDGCSPYGCSEKVAQALKDADIHDVSAYPHGFALKDAIIRRWQAYVPLTYDMLYLHNSGMDAIACVNTIFARPGAAVVGICHNSATIYLAPAATALSIGLCISSRKRISA